MPELPEVENVRRQLVSLLRLSDSSEPRYLFGVEFYRRDLRFPFSKALLSKLESGQELGPLRRIGRRAKYLVFEFDQGSVLSHLGMTGSWREIPSGQLPENFKKEKRKHDHVRLIFDGGQSFVFEDPRRFGYMEWVDKDSAHKLLKNLGPEPLSQEFTADYLFKATRGKTSTIKSFIMDARRVVGVGNIYASEALFRAKVRPLRKAGRLKADDAQSLVRSIQDVLEQAISAGGSTIRDFKGVDGYRGGFQDLHLVYNRAGEPCRICQTKIVSKMITGRSTFWCPNCQPR